MSYHRHIRRNTEEYQQELKDLIDLKSLNKTVKTPSKHIPLKRLKQIKQDNYVGETGKEFSQEELDQAIVDRETAYANKKVKQYEKDMWNPKGGQEAFALAPVRKSLIISIFEPFEELEKSEAPKYENHIDEEKGRIGKIHPNGTLMWHHLPQLADKNDRIINNQNRINSFLSKLPESHRDLASRVISHVAKDPNRHFIPTEEGGRNKLRARHIKDLLLGNRDITIDTKEPGVLKINRSSHSQGKNLGRQVSFEFRAKGAGNVGIRKTENNDGRRASKDLQNVRSRDGFIGSLFAKRSGVHLEKSRGHSSKASNGDGRSLDKAIDPKSFKKVTDSHNKVKMQVSDHAAHGANHPTEDSHFLDHVINSPKTFKDESKYHTKGISPKNILHVDSYKDSEGQTVSLQKPKTFMVKPYHGHLESATKTYTKNPIKGWATLTTKDLLHAADMGHMAEDVSYHEYQGVPLTVHKFSDNHEDLFSGHKTHPLDLQKIAVMDFLTNNVDRHSGNIMMSKSPSTRYDHHDDDRYKGQVSDPLLIDHERNFQYNRSINNRFGAYSPAKSKESVSDYLWGSTGLGQIGSQFKKYEIEEHTEGLASWWDKNSQNIEQAFNKNLAHIKDEKLKNHIASNFKQRMDSIHHIFNNENYYDMFKPGAELGAVNVGKTKAITSKAPKKLAASEEAAK